MGKRFVNQRRERGGAARELLLPAALFLLLCAFLIQGIGSLSDGSDSEGLRGVERAVENAVVQCYAIEGRYPPSLDYLEDHYGLRVDRERYIVRYEIFGSNIMPTVMVFPMDLSGWEAEYVPF